ncbi:MAG: class I SAM-dependent methyltransferase [Polyangia bacterium]
MAISLFRRKREGGIQTRTDLLNHLIATKGYQRYLEIGVRDPRQNFEKVKLTEKHSVDPNPRRPVTHRMTSDDFFARRRNDGLMPPYDLAFIDGLHLAEQVERDVVNCMENLTPAGTIVLHDCNPLTADAQTDDYDGKKHWNGTVWKAWVKLRATRPDLSMWVVDIDEGCGVIRRGGQRLLPLPSLNYEAMGFDFLATNRREALNLVSLNQFLEAMAAENGAAPRIS